MELEPGTIEALCDNQTDHPLCVSPVLQIISFSLPEQGQAMNKIKANLSDGKFYVKTAISSNYIEHFKNGILKNFSLVKLKKFGIKSKDDLPILIIVSIDIFQNCDKKIGAPVSIAYRHKLVDEYNADNMSGKTISNSKESYSTVVSSPPLKTHQVVQENKKVKSSESEKCLKIVALNPFLSNWTIKGTVITKSDLRTYNSQKKTDGKLFSFEFQDDSGQIKITAFNESADAFYKLIEENKSYKISKGLIKMANKQYSINNSDYEITLDKSTNLEILEDEIKVKVQFNFVKINDVVACNNLDVVGIIKESYTPSTITSKLTKKEILKKDLVLVDETGSIKVTLFGNKAENQFVIGDALAIKCGKSAEYNGMSISTTVTSQLFINPLEDRACELKGWYENNKSNLPSTVPVKREIRNLIQEVREQEIEYSTLVAAIIFIREENLWYDSCVTENCSKKVSLEDNGKFRCEKCNLQFDECDARYIISAHISDFSGQIWATLFNETGKLLLDISAKELRAMKEESPEQIPSHIKSCFFKEKVFKLKSRHEHYNNEPRTKYNVIGIEDVDYLKETKRVMKELQKKLVG